MSKSVLNYSRITERQRLLLLRDELAKQPQKIKQIEHYLYLVLERYAFINSIGAYFAIRNEFNPLLILNDWLQEKDFRNIYLPKVIVSNKDMVYKRWYPSCEMKQDVYGISYPVGTDEGKPELLLVPCVGYSKQGHRLGYGGGYYDRVLAKNMYKPLTIGIAFADCLLENFVPNQYDQTLDVILTEQGILNFSNCFANHHIILP